MDGGAARKNKNASLSLSETSNCETAGGRMIGDMPTDRTILMVDNSGQLVKPTPFAERTRVTGSSGLMAPAPAHDEDYTSQVEQ